MKSLEIKIARSENLPVLPQVVSQVLKLADDHDASPRAMEKIISSDAAITAKILKVANSSYYGLSQVSGIGRAISMLGMNTVRSLVVGVAYQQLMAGKAISTRFNKLEYWRHSLATATAARILAKLKLPMKSEEFYVAGMMHDIGILVMDRFHPLDLDKAIQLASQERMRLFQAERIMFGFDHSLVGSLLAEKWSLTPLILSAIRYHHEPEADEENQQYTAIVTLADQLAHDCGFTNSLPKEDHGIDEMILYMVGLPREQMDVIKAIISQEVARAEEAFGV